MSTRVLVNLGCGSVWHDAWQNFDLAPPHPAVRALDLGRALPFADGSVDAVYHAHVLEHLAPAAAHRLIGDCCRILKSGGLIRVVVPDLEETARRYLAALGRDDDLDYDWAVLELLDQLVRTKSEGQQGEFLREQPWRDHPRIRDRVAPGTDAAQPTASPPPLPRRPHRLTRALRRLRFTLARLCLTRREAELLDEARFRAAGEVHRWMYDRRSLGRLLREAGFTAPVPRTATDSAISGFAAFHLDATDTGLVRHPDSLYLEAAKP